MFRVFSRRSPDPKASLQGVLGSYELPCFPAVAQKVLAEIRNPDSSPVSVSEALRADPGLSARVLRTLNSAAFALRNRVDDLKQAVALLGLNSVESIVLSVTVGNLLPQPRVPGFSNADFWMASARRAAVAQRLARLIHPKTADISFTAALLQDMALPFLALQRPDVYGPLLSTWRESKQDLVTLEQESCGWDHAEVGTWIAQEWEFPDLMVEAIGVHHDEEAIPKELTAVALVSCLRESEADPGTTELRNRVRALYKVDDTALRDAITEGLEDAQEIAQLFV